MRRVLVGVGHLLVALAASLGLACAAPAAPQPPTAPQPAAPGHSAAFHYNVRVGGVLSGSVDVEATYDAQTYRVVADTRSRGPVDLIIGFRSHAVTQGKTTGPRPSPETHRADNIWMGETRWVRMSYANGLRPEDKVFPTAEADDRTVVPQKEWDGTVDPITATYDMMLAAAKPEHCTSMIKVFDGRRRYNLVGTYDGTKALRADLFHGQAANCAYEIVQLGGRQRHPWWPKSRDPKTAHVYFAKLSPDLPPVGVRVQAHAGFIPVRLELTRLVVDGRAIGINSNNEASAAGSGN
jgi:hypothetical protein